MINNFRLASLYLFYYSIQYYFIGQSAKYLFHQILLNILVNYTKNYH